MLSTLRQPRRTFSRQSGRDDHGLPPCEPLPPSEPCSVDDLWGRALEEYNMTVGTDLRNLTEPVMLALKECTTGDAILDAIEGMARRVQKKREGNKTSHKLRQVLRPLVHGLSVVLNVCGETASSLGVPGGKGIFVAIAVLLKAAEGVSAKFDDIEQLLERFRIYVERLQVRTKAPLRREARTIAVQGLVEMLKAFALATKMLRKNRLGLFLKALSTKGDGMQRVDRALDEIMSAEEKMAITDVLVGMNELSSDVLGVCTSISEATETAKTATRAALVEIRESEGRRRIDAAAMKDILMTLLERSQPIDGDTNATVQSRPQAPAPATGVVRSAEAEPVYPSNWHTQLLCVVHRFSPQDQDIIWRAFATFLSCIVDSAGVDLGRSDALAQFAEFGKPMIPTACMFFLLFMIWRLRSVSRPTMETPGSIMIVDVLGDILELRPEAYSTWENTHAYMVQAFQNRPGQSYVHQQSYGLGNSDRLLIDPDEWPHVVKSGAKLKMIIIVGAYVPRCPYCQTVTKGHEVTTTDGRVICARIECGRPYAIHQDRTRLPSREARMFGASLSHIHTVPGIYDPSVVLPDELPTSESIQLFHRVVVKFMAKLRSASDGPATVDQQSKSGKVGTKDDTLPSINPEIDYVVRLNNYLAYTRQHEMFGWHTTRTPGESVDAPQRWHVTAILHTREVGTGHETSKSGAKRRAVFQALVNLNQL